MKDGLIWQNDENIIEVVYDTIYGLPVKTAMEIVKMYTENQLIPRMWLKNKMYITLGNKWDNLENVKDVIDVIDKWQVQLYETDR